MFVDLKLLLGWLALLLPLYWAIPRTEPVIRGIFLSFGSVCVLISIAPYAAALVLICALWVSFWSKIFLIRRGLLLPVVIATVGLITVWREEAPQISIWQLGVPFIMLRTVSLLVDANRGERIPPLQALLLCLFFPTFSAGPIERSRAFSLDYLKQPLSFVLLSSSSLRVLIGLFKINYLSNAIFSQGAADLIIIAEQNPTIAGIHLLAAQAILRFLAIYIEFSGISDVAIGLGGVFGFRIRENFNNPLVASDILSFWRRWHRSLADWMGAYLHQPLIRATGRTELSIFVGFVLIGLWHDLSVPQLVWGGGHGLLVIGYRYFSRGRQKQKRTYVPILGWAMTMTAVIILSFIAGFETMADCLRRVQLLLGQ